MMKMYKKVISLLAFLLFQISNALTQFRFPRPEFENGHQQPPTPSPLPRSLFLEYLDVGILVIALILASYFAIKKRSRKGLLYLSIFSIIYFGFFREGCICSVGSIQNIALALFNPNYFIPISAIIFFLLPILFTLFFGRTFCAGVCPLGAIQDVFLIKAVKLPRPLTRVLGMIPYLYLGFAVLFAATGSDFIICRYDPFVGFFRLNAQFIFFFLGGLFLLTSMFVARPYCRFFCAYGVILNWVSRFSKWHLSITPSHCIQCRLCENACPYDAIHVSTKENTPQITKNEVNKLKAFFLLIPVFIFLGGVSLSTLSTQFAKVHPKVKLSQMLEIEKDYPTEELSLEVKTFRALGQTWEELNIETQQIQKQFYTGSWILGGFFGLCFALALINLSIKKKRIDYEPDKGNCLSCGRCFSSCPIENDLTK